MREGQAGNVDLTPVRGVAAMVAARPLLLAQAAGLLKVIVTQANGARTAPIKMANFADKNALFDLKVEFIKRARRLSLPAVSDVQEGEIGNVMDQLVSETFSPTPSTLHQNRTGVSRP